jgi:hypothetical protein
MLGYPVKKYKKLMPPPEYSDIKGASTDVAWEYVMLLGAALEMVTAHGQPINHMVQEVFLVHARNLAEFFCGGVQEFKDVQAPPERPKDNIYAVDFCHSVGWKTKALQPNRILIKAINKTLSHMTYSRDRASKTHAHFEGHLHLHGTVTLMRQTWADFLKSVKPQFLQPQCPTDIHYWLVEHTKEWPVRFSDLGSEFETRVKELVRTSDRWTLNQTPDGQIL